ncbi:MAG: glycosyltransferase, partial [Steroidobacteraceae bacterium]
MRIAGRAMAIPARAHFCWLGTSLPWAYVFAVLSAAERSGMAEIILHHTDTLEDDARLRALERCPRVRLSRLDPVACLTIAGHALDLGTGLVDIYRTLEHPAMRADMLRAALLYGSGGVYLDLDTVTVASLLPLLDVPQFVGCERIVWPHSVRSSRSPGVWCRALALDVLRKAMRRAPHGWRMFRRVERLYHRGINNAVMGAQAGSSLCALYLRGMIAMPPERRSQLYALGPDLLAEVAERLPAGEITVAEPHVFYPLPPEISEHWFRVSRGARAGAPVRLEAVLSE